MSTAMVRMVGRWGPSLGSIGSSSGCRTGAGCYRTNGCVLFNANKKFQNDIWFFSNVGQNLTDKTLKTRRIQKSPLYEFDLGSDRPFF